jgi:RNA polymerase sporulation-specific sigma factor
MKITLEVPFKNMLNKVEICGVNTSKLPVLTNEEKNMLFKRIKQGDKDAREQFVKGNLRLVLSVIQRFTMRGENVDDLFQVGCIGLIKSIDNFNTELNVQFSTYAVPMIIGEIRRYLRDNNAIRVSRSLKDIAYKALSAKEKLTNEGEREPTIEEIAKEIDIPQKDVANALSAIQDPMSLFEPIYNDNGDAVFVMDQVSDEKSYDENWIEEIALKEAMKKLNDREKHILNLRFFKGKTQIEVAQEIGVSCNEFNYKFKRGGFGKNKPYEIKFLSEVFFVL